LELSWMAKGKRSKARIIPRDLKVVNIGVPTFADDLRSQGVEVVNLAWKPPAGGDVEMLKLLDKLGS